MNNELNDDDVVSMDKKKNLAQASTSRISELINEIKDLLSGSYQYHPDWLEDGVECELLQVGGSWRKGKIRLHLEFIPDEPEVTSVEVPLLLPSQPSPLADLRSSLKLGIE
ncbi:KGK domain-containing protein [Nostoc sp.]|uniref:KGK domain-containing protein n=1 Tax=Nostoc sp. TaxID=1180 RepID=UPI002FFA1B1E